MNEKTTQTLLTALLLCVAALLYLDWKRQGEIELLHERLDNLRLDALGMSARDGASVRRDVAPVPAPSEPVAPAATAPPPPAPMPTVVIADPVPGDGNFMPAEAPTIKEIHPLLRAVATAHGNGTVVTPPPEGAVA